jgi:hypothetical protein
MGRLSRLFGGELEHSTRRFWRGNTFTQTNVSLKNYEEHVIEAKIDGKWGQYTIRELPQEFMDWNIGSRIEALAAMKEGRMPSLAGPHSASVASYGGGRLDTEFTVNNAVKGLGFVPKKDKIEEIIGRLEETRRREIGEKFEILESIYRAKNLLDKTKQVSLELYTQRDFETHTFLNIMTNPSVSIVFLDMPSYEIRAVARLIHPEDDSASAEEKSILHYVNLIHDYFHGESLRRSIAMVFHVVEVFDNSPARRGVRVTPM